MVYSSLDFSDLLDAERPFSPSSLSSERFDPQRIVQIRLRSKRSCVREYDENDSLGLQAKGIKKVLGILIFPA